MKDLQNANFYFTLFHFAFYLQSKVEVDPYVYGDDYEDCLKRHVLLLIMLKLRFISTVQVLSVASLSLSCFRPLSTP